VDTRIAIRQRSRQRKTGFSSGAALIVIFGNEGVFMVGADAAIADSLLFPPPQVSHE
jgi:hypothetical protein